MVSQRQRLQRGGVLSKWVVDDRAKLGFTAEVSAKQRASRAPLAAEKIALQAWGDCGRVMVYYFLR